MEGDAQQWYKALPLGSIYSLREFHACFHYHYRIIFRDELLFEDYCNEESTEQVAQENLDDEVFTDEDCDQELKEQVYYGSEDEEDILIYEETSMDSLDLNASESYQEEISNNSKHIHDSFDFQEVSMRSLELMMKILVLKSLPIINK
jgi:hypothetical protein